MFGFNFTPRGWANCNGALLPIASNSALFSLLGTIYGGDGRSTFALPDLRGRTPLNQGNGPGLSNRQIGSKAGQEAVTLSPSEMPNHSHTFSGNLATTDAVGNSSTPSGNSLAKANDGESNYSNGASNGAMPISGTLSATGGSLPHDNMPPFLTVNFCIATVGIFPSRN